MGGLRWAVRVEVRSMGSLGLGAGLVVMVEASGVRTRDQGGGAMESGQGWANIGIWGVSVAV